MALYCAALVLFLFLGSVEVLPNKYAGDSQLHLTPPWGTVLARYFYYYLVLMDAFTPPTFSPSALNIVIY